MGLIAKTIAVEEVLTTQIPQNRNDRPQPTQKIRRSNQPFTTDQSKTKIAIEMNIGTKMIAKVKFLTGSAAATGVGTGVD